MNRQSTFFKQNPVYISEAVLTKICRTPILRVKDQKKLPTGCWELVWDRDWKPM